MKKEGPFFGGSTGPRDFNAERRGAMKSKEMTADEREQEMVLLSIQVIQMLDMVEPKQRSRFYDFLHAVFCYRCGVRINECEC